jgi:hypothetical protein
MALFGLFGNDEQEYEQQREQPREKSFLSKVGSFLMGALKWAAVAVAAVVTLGTVFKFSEGAKDFADKNLGGIGTGTVNLLDKGIDKVKGIFGFGSTDAPPPPASTTENIGGVETVRANPKLYKPQTPVDLSKELTNLNNALVSKEAAEAGRKSLDARSKENMQVGLAIEDLNSASNGKIGKEQVAKGAPKPPTIDLNLPKLPESLELSGASKNPSSWSGLSPLQKIQSLEQSIGLPRDPINKPEALAKSEPFVRGLGKEGSIKSMEDAVRLGWEGSPVGDFINEHKRWDNRAKEVIATLVKEERYQEATIVASGAKEYLTKLGSALPESERENRGKDYRQFITDMDKIKEYTTRLQERKELEPVLNETHAAINVAAKQAPIVLAGYDKQIAEFRNKVKADADSAARDAAATAERDAVAKAKREADAAKNGDGSKKDGTKVDDPGSSKAPLPLSVVPPKEQAGLGK